MKIAFLLAALCGMLLATTAAMTFDDDEMDQLQDPMSFGKFRGCVLRNDLEEPVTADEIEDMMHMNDQEMEDDDLERMADPLRIRIRIRRRGRDEPVTADEIEDMLHMMDPQGQGGRRRPRPPQRPRRPRRPSGGRPSIRPANTGSGRRNDIFQSPTTTDDEMMQDPLLGFGWGWGSPWGGWGGWGRRGWGGWGRRGWGGWGRRGWGRRYFDSDDSSNQEMQGEESETISADDLEDMMMLDPQGGRRGGYRGDRDRYRGDRDRYRGRRNDMEL